MAVIVSDSFTDTNGTELSVHDPFWQKVTIFSGTQGTVTINSNMATQITSGTTDFVSYIYNKNLEPDQIINFDAYNPVLNTGVTMAMAMARMDVANKNGYIAGHNNTNNRSIIRINNGVQTQLGTYSPGSSPVGVVAYKFELIGSALKLYVAGVVRVSVTDSTFLGAGFSGILGRSASTSSNSLAWDNVSIEGVIVSSHTIIPSGGITFSGTGNQIDFREPNHVIPTAGKITFSGLGNQANTSVPPYIINPSGGIVFSGTGNILNEKSPPHIILTSGGIVFGGSAPMLFNYEPPIGGGPRMPLTGVGL